MYMASTISLPNWDRKSATTNLQTIINKEGRSVCLPSFYSYLLHHDFAPFSEIDATKRRLAVKTNPLKRVPAFVHGLTLSFH